MSKSKPERTRDIVKLADLAPRHDVKGGAGRRVFGADSFDARSPARAGRSPAEIAKSKKGARPQR